MISSLNRGEIYDCTGYQSVRRTKGIPSQSLWLWHIQNRATKKKEISSITLSLWSLSKSSVNKFGGNRHYHTGSLIFLLKKLIFVYSFQYILYISFGIRSHNFGSIYGLSLGQRQVYIFSLYFSPFCSDSVLNIC